MPTARPLICEVRDQLTDHSALDARWLLGLAIGRDAPLYGHEDIVLTAPQSARLAALIKARRSGQPISRMRGKRAFWQSQFYLNTATLDPRPDSEILIESANQFLKTRASSPAPTPFSILDLGTGTGCLLLSMLQNHAQAKGIGTDLSALAIAQARANAAYLGLARRAQFHQTDWATGITGRFDIIFSNPPYIRQDAPLPKDIDFDPPLALYGGKTGLEAYHTLLPAVYKKLSASGRAFIELGAGQAVQVRTIAIRHHLYSHGYGYDLLGRQRCLILGK